MIDFVKVAHRGSSGSSPENTLRAFEKALDARVDMIEIDCQLSKDGHVVVIHDERLERTTGAKGWVRSKTLQQLQALDAGAWFKKSFKGEKIPTLVDAMEIVAGRADIILDIKQIPKGLLGIELKILFILSHYDYLRRSLITSFDVRALSRVRELAPAAEIGVLVGSSIAANPFQPARELKARSLLIEKRLATPALLDKARQFGLTTFVWTVNELKEMETLLSMGADGIISDFPEKFWKIKQRKKR